MQQGAPCTFRHTAVSSELIVTSEGLSISLHGYYTMYIVLMIAQVKTIMQTKGEDL